MGNTNKTNRKLEICIEALSDSRGGYIPIISIGDVKLNLKANTYETVDQAISRGTKNFISVLEIMFRSTSGNSFYL